jgi:hypothetical protein
VSIEHWLWWDNNCRWPEFIQLADREWGSDKVAEEFKNRVRWIYENIENPERHCRWNLDYPDMMFCFRYERDQLMFVMRWS